MFSSRSKSNDDDTTSGADTGTDLSGTTSEDAVGVEELSRRDVKRARKEAAREERQREADAKAADRLAKKSEAAASKASRSGSGREWIRLLVFVVFVVGVAAALSWVLADKPVDDADKSFSGAAADGFDRPAGGLGETEGGKPWEEVSGGWAVAAGAAYVERPSDGGIDIAVLHETPAPASITALIGGQGACGVVAAAEDAKNYVAFVYVDGYKSWNLIVMRDGKKERIGGFVLEGSGDVGARLVVDPPVVSVSVGIKKATFEVSKLPKGDGAGLYQDNSGAARCTFDDVQILTPN